MVEGGLQVRDLVHANMALGCKLLWNLCLQANQLLWHTCLEANHLVSQILKKKYLKYSTIMNYKEEKHPKGMHARKLCVKGIEFFRSHLYSILVMGRIPIYGKTYSGTSTF